MALNHTDYLLEALEELQKHASKTLKQARKCRRRALSAWWDDSDWFIRRADELENIARQDLERIQKILADPALNR